MSSRPFVGGAFGSALRTWPHVTDRGAGGARGGSPGPGGADPARNASPPSGLARGPSSACRLGAERDGKLTAMIQEARGQTSTYEEYAEVTLDPPRALYSCPNVADALPAGGDEHQLALFDARAWHGDRGHGAGNGDG